MNKYSPAFAWQESVAYEIAKRCEFVLVLTEDYGEHRNPSNMIVRQIPLRPVGISRNIGGSWLFNTVVFELCKKHKIDVAFFHMALVWVGYLWPSFRLLNIPILLWHAYGEVSSEVKKALHHSNRVVTSCAEGFCITSAKRYIIGQGIDTALFSIQQMNEERNQLIYVGRISPIKRLDLLLDIIDCIYKSSIKSKIKLNLIGPILVQEDIEYDRYLRERIFTSGLEKVVSLTGYIPQQFLPQFYKNAFLHINLCNSAMDKTVLESLSIGCPVITTNKAFKDMLVGYPELYLETEDAEAIAKKIVEIHRAKERYIPEHLRNLIVGKHDIFTYVEKIVKHLKAIENI